MDRYAVASPSWFREMLKASSPVHLVLDEIARRAEAHMFAYSRGQWVRPADRLARLRYTRQDF